MIARRWTALLGLVAAACSQSNPLPTRFELPEDPLFEVISLDYTSGPWSEKAKPGPLLSVRAGGTVRVQDIFEGAPDVEIAISPDELQDLLRFVLVENRFFEIDEKLDDSIPYTITDQRSTIIGVHLPGRAHKVSVYALSYNAERDSRSELTRLEAIQRRLVALAKRVQESTKR